MEFDSEIQQIIKKYEDYVFVVEGKKDVAAMNNIGFERVHTIHNTGVPIRKRIEEIQSILRKKDKVCILTDFDKKGKQLYLLLKKEFSEAGVRLDGSFRGILLKSGVSHIEGLDSYMNKIC